MSELTRVRELCDMLIAAEALMNERQAALDDAKGRYNDIRLVALPELMAEVGLSEVKLEDGTVISITEEVAASIKEANRVPAMRWLVDHGYAGLIKSRVIVNTTPEEAEELYGSLRGNYPELDLDEKVHPMTLKSFVKERLAAGEDVPMDLFGVHPYSVAKIKRIKK